MAARKLRIGGWVPSPDDTQRDPQVTTLLPQLAPGTGAGRAGSEPGPEPGVRGMSGWLVGLIAAAAVAVLLVGGAGLAMLLTSPEPPAVFVAPDQPPTGSTGATPGREPTVGRAVTQGREPAVPPPAAAPSPAPGPSPDRATGTPPTPSSAPAPEPVSVAFEAEAGALSGGAVVLPSPAASGGQVVQFLGSQAAVEFGLTVPDARELTLTIFYISGVGGRAAVSVGERRIGTVEFPATGRRSVGSVTVAITLPAGESTVRISAAGGWAPALDRLTITDR